MTLRRWTAAVVLCAMAFCMVGCDTVNRANYEKISPYLSRRADVHDLLGAPETRAASIVMPDREVYYAGDRVGRSHIIVYYVDDLVVEKQWVE